jgi:Flp pilus assembly protein TadG
MTIGEKYVNSMRRFALHKDGNVTLIFGFAIIPLMLAGGIAIDYTRDAMIRGRLTAVADAASLAATTPAMLAQPSATARAAAQTMFAAQAALINGLTYDPSKLSVLVTDANGANGITRNVSVTYDASVANLFGSLENLAHTGFRVSSTAYISAAPNINFYLMLDSSPSMEIPATTAGITSMVKNTGCALACHETNFKDSEYTVQYKGWGTIDSYTYAKNAGITLRIDNVRESAKSLVTTAQSMMTSNKSTYQMAAYTFSDGVTKLLSLAQTSSANVSSMQTSIAAITPPLMSDNSYLAKGATITYPKSNGSYVTATLTANTLNNDAGTNFNNALNVVNADMATPGTGTSKTGDTPQGVLLIVTDGVDDVSLYKSSSCNTSQVWSFSNSYGNFYRCQQPVNTALCSTIKARGIRIGVLYTTYYPVTSNSWYNTTVAPFISQVATNLQNCASSSNLYFEVSTDGDITAAMQQLFINAVATAPHLIQ